MTAVPCLTLAKEPPKKQGLKRARYTRLYSPERTDKMDFNTAMEKISSLLRFGSMPGLARIQKLLDNIGNPERKCRFIHVAGTNGKGSICTMLSEILRKSGYKTGLFTSPYIIEFCDRISIDGEIIPKNDVADIVEKIFPIIEQMNANGEPITEFECITAIAFEYFYRQSCDIVVLETGLGGRFDSTNVISTPVTSVITSISLDHTAVLGDTLDMIAAEKAGIIKQGGSTVFCPQEDIVNKVITKTAQSLDNKLYGVDMSRCTVLSEQLGNSKFEYKGEKYAITLAGRHQIKNACTVVEAVTPLRNAGFDVNDEAVKYGIKKAFIPARFEVVKNDPLTILDGGHNPSGLAALSSAVKEYLPDKHISCVMSMLRDKAVECSLVHLKGLFDKVYIVEIENPRKMPAQQLKAIADSYFDCVEICLDKQEAISRAINDAKQSGGAALVCGSLYLASEIRKIILEKL
ncbi:bifunctional folylpolyglutamate synthase/dihydrofolate synthase [Ruminococcus sp. zg-924]|nr:bifunctional folylpolyglutamate synthase/dihydrofolate synthase [Ruminococcus sp. zg-924]